MFPQNKALMLLPLGYLVATRMNTAKALLSNATSAWIPGVYLITAWGGLGVFEALTAYAVGYLAFACVYELGYLANDTMGTRNDETPRHRLKLTLTRAYILLFVVIRVAVFAGIAHCCGFTQSTAWLAGFIALIVVMVLHNTLHSPALKAASFLQMSVLRFSLPVLPFLPLDRIAVLLLLALFHFTYPRFITYLDAKGRLRIPERRTASYGPAVQAILVPAFGLLSAVSSSAVPLIVWFYYMMLQAARWALAKSGHGKTAD